MAPVIRISDDVFRRLQRISEPLVDTPSQIIERILTRYEESAIRSAGSVTANHVPEKTPVLGIGQIGADDAEDRRLFIAPASDANLDRTIRNYVRVTDVESVLSPAQAEALRAVTGESQRFHCWAMTESRRPVFDAMRPGDYVVLIAPKTAFTATVQYKLVSERLGNHLWPSQPRLPWKFIYLLTDIRERRVRKDRLNKAFGYKASHAFPGVARVRADALRSALDHHGTIDKLIAACSS